MFQNCINNILAPYLDCFCTVYLDDTLLYLDTFNEYQYYICLVMDTFARVCLHLKPTKYIFHCQELKCFGSIISIQGIKIVPEIFYAIQDGEGHTNMKDIHIFLGFANFYH
jgi:hypothetical protein